VALLKQYEKDGTLIPQLSLAQCQSLAEDFIEAYKSGDSGAIQRLKEHFQLDRTPNREGLREYVRRRLGLPAGGENESADLAPADAQLLVARAHGFESWLQLRKHTEG
jgi:hypothetical protein